MFTFPMAKKAIQRFVTESLANQRVVTVSELKVIEILAPDDTTMELFIDGNSVGNMTDAGGGIFTYDWTPASVSHTGVTIEAVGNASGLSEQLLIVVAEANAINTNISAWTRNSGSLSFTSSQADPFGGTGATLLTCAATTSATRFITSPTLSPTMTEPNHGLDIWVKSNGVEWFYFDGGQGGAYLNINSGEGWGNGCYAKVIESIGTWRRVWVRRENETAVTANVWYLRFSNGMATGTNFTTAGGGGAYFYLPRTVDGILPLTTVQKYMAYEYSTLNGAEWWIAQHPDATNGSIIMNGGGITTLVIRPDGWTANGNYKKLLLLPALTYIAEGAIKIETLAIEGDYANLYNCVVIIPMIGSTTSGYIWQYYGNQTDGQYQLHTYITEVVTYFAEQFLGCSTNPNLCAAVGYSKSANGAFSMLFLRPDKIGVACGWDGHWDQHEFFRVRDSVNPNYTTVENSEYFDPYLNVANRVSSFNDRERLILLGGSVWNPDLALMKAALDATGVDYQYYYEFNAVHSFSSGWLDDAVQRTMALCVP